MCTLYYTNPFLIFYRVLSGLGRFRPYLSADRKALGGSVKREKQALVEFREVREHVRAASGSQDDEFRGG